MNQVYLNLSGGAEGGEIIRLTCVTKNQTCETDGKQVSRRARDAFFHQIAAQLAAIWKIAGLSEACILHYVAKI